MRLMFFVRITFENIVFCCLKLHRLERERERERERIKKKTINVSGLWCSEVFDL